MKKYKNGKLIFIRKIIIWTLLLCCVTQGLKITGPQKTGKLENRDSYKNPFCNPINCSCPSLFRFYRQREKGTLKFPRPYTLSEVEGY